MNTTEFIIFLWWNNHNKCFCFITTFVGIIPTYFLPAPQLLLWYSQHIYCYFWTCFLKDAVNSDLTLPCPTFFGKCTYIIHVFQYISIILSKWGFNFFVYFQHILEFFQLRFLWQRKLYSLMVIIKLLLPKDMSEV